MASNRVGLTHQLIQQRFQRLAARPEVFTLAVDDAAKVGHRPFEVFIHDHVLELIPVGHIADRVAKSSVDDLVRIGIAISQAIFKRAPSGISPVVR